MFSFRKIGLIKNDVFSDTLIINVCFICIFDGGKQQHLTPRVYLSSEMLVYASSITQNDLNQRFEWKSQKNTKLQSVKMFSYKAISRLNSINHSK